MEKELLSHEQFMNAIGFIKSYKDALNCVEEIAEKRVSYDHYEKLSKTLAEGIEKN